MDSVCKNYEITINLIKIAAVQAGVEIGLEKIIDMDEIMNDGVMPTPGVVVDGNVVHWWSDSP